MVVWPLELLPQPTTVPSLLSARLWKSPLAMAVTPVRPLGMEVWPLLL